MPNKAAATPTPKTKSRLSKKRLEQLAQRDFELLENHTCRVTTKRGEGHLSIVNNPRFEMLFEMGAIALLDGYCREAIASLAASLERYYEFHFRAIAHAKQIDDAAFKAAWKHLGQSERQLGAFVAACLLDSEQAPAILPEALTKLRNKVIHHGTIAPWPDAMKYGEKALQIIRIHLRALAAKYPDLKSAGA